ncbi:MAG: DeoR/GlpR family DNA-binding transcription regulator [Botrimarina sp.]
MLARQRQIEILRDLQQEGAVSVTELAERFDVTDETIRRDLAKLANGGQLVRTHGGAVLSESAQVDAPFAVRQGANSDAKRAIAHAAAELVRPGDVVAIDASTTALELAIRLPPAPATNPITVISNGVGLIQRLADRPGLRLISTGGELDRTGACFVGSIAEATLSQFACSHALLSCRALDPRRGAGEAGPSHAAIKRLMLSISEQSHLLADSSKLQEKAVCFFAPLDRFTTVVVDDGLDEGRRGELERSTARLLIAPRPSAAPAATDPSGA